MFTPYGNDGQVHQIPQGDGRMNQIGAALPPGATRRPDGRVILANGQTQGFHPGGGYGIAGNTGGGAPNTHFPTVPPPPMVHNDLLTRGPGVGQPGQTPPWMQPPPQVQPGQPQPYPEPGGGLQSQSPWMQDSSAGGYNPGAMTGGGPGASGSSMGGAPGAPLPTAPGSPYPTIQGIPPPSYGSSSPSPYGAGASTLGGLSPGVPGGPPLPTQAGSPYGGAGVTGGAQNQNGPSMPGGAGGAGSPFPGGSTQPDRGNIWTTPTQAGAPTGTFAGSAGIPMANKAFGQGNMMNRGQLDATGTHIWQGGGGSEQGQWQNYNASDPNQKGVADMFQRYGSNWTAGPSGAFGHSSEMPAQFQALYGRQGSPQELNDLLYNVNGDASKAHDAFANQSAAYNPASNSYNPQSAQNLTSLNLLAHQ